MTTLKERLDDVLQKKWDGNMSRWSEAAGLERIHVSKLLGRDSTNEGAVYVQVIEKLARVAGVSPGWLAFGDGFEEEPAIGTFLLKLDRKPGLRDVIDAHPGRWKTSTVARAVMVDWQSDSAGIPLRGWEAALDGLEKKDSPPGTASAVVAATKRQVGRRRALPRSP